MDVPILDKDPKKRKKNKYDRKADLDYNKLLYGPLAQEDKQRVKRKIDFGKGFLDNPKFPQFIAAIKTLGSFKFDAQVNDGLAIISYDGHFVRYNDIKLCYTRPCNRYEDLMVLEKPSLAKHQLNPGLVHLVFAILRSFPELPKYLTYTEKRFRFEGEAVDTSSELEMHSNLVVGSFKHGRFEDRDKNYKRS